MRAEEVLSEELALDARRGSIIQLSTRVEEIFSKESLSTRAEGASPAMALEYCALRAEGAASGTADVERKRPAPEPQLIPRGAPHERRDEFVEGAHRGAADARGRCCGGAAGAAAWAASGRPEALPGRRARAAQASSRRRVSH